MIDTRAVLDPTQYIRSSYHSVCFRTATPTAFVPAPFDQNDPSGGGVTPFRRATQEKVVQLTQETFTAATTLTRINRTVEGNGYIYGMVLDVQAVTAANAAAVTFTEDAPWNALDTVVLADTAGELVRCSGFDLFIANLAGRQYVGTFQSASALIFTATTGAGATGGTIRFGVRVPVGLNRRSLSAMVGNQDRGTRYQLRSDFAASASIWATAPTTLPPVTIDKYYEYYTLPNPTNNRGEKQQQVPDDYGRLHFITATDFANAPAPSSTVNHYLIRIGNSIRFVALIFRAGTGTTQRATAEANAPTAIQLKIGDDLVFQDSWRYRRWLMYERYGFDFPSGVLVYDAMHDFGIGSGNEVGDDYWYTQGLNNAQFIITYPAGYTTGGTLHAITDDLQEVLAS